MRKFLQELFTFSLFVASIVCFYLSLTAFFASMLINIICFFSAVFLLVQASGMVDRIKGFGPNSNSNSNSNLNQGNYQHEKPKNTITENTSDTPTYEGDDEI